MKKIPTLKTLFWLNSSGAGDGDPTVYCRLTVDGVRSEISLQRTIARDQWHKGAVIGKNAAAKALDNYISIFKTGVLEHFNNMIAANKEITAESLKCEILGIVKEEDRKKTFGEMAKAMNKEFQDKVDKKKRSPETLKHLKKSQEFFFDFLKAEKNVDDILLEKLDVSYCYDFEHYLSITLDQSSNHYMKQIKNIKQVLIFSKNKNQIKENPFSGFQCKYVDPEIIPLEQHELDAIWSHPMPIERLCRVRDCFIFACYTGYAFTDLLSLQEDNIITSLDGEKWMVKDRTKTDVAEKVLLLPIPLQIIEIFKNCPDRKPGFLFPEITNTNYNAYLKEIFVIVGINKEPSSHDARHAFATTVTLENDVPIESVQKMLGHKSIRTTQRYAKVTKRKLTNNMQALRSKLTVVNNNAISTLAKAAG